MIFYDFLAPKKIQEIISKLPVLLAGPVCRVAGILVLNLLEDKELEFLVWPCASGNTGDWHGGSGLLLILFRVQEWMHSG